MPILLDAGPSARGFHRLEAAARCPQLYAYKYLLNVKFPPGDALIRGSLVHVVLAHYYARLREVQKGRDPETYYAPRVALTLASEKLAAQWKTDLPIEKAVGLQTLAEEYETHWFNEGWTVLKVEEPVEAYVGPRKRRYTARLDLVVEDRAGQVWSVDHKTSAKPDARTVDGYSLSGQFHALRRFGSRDYGQRFAGCLINLISGDKPPFTFKRIPAHAAPHATTQYPQFIEDVESRLDALEAEGRDPWNYPKANSDLACVHRYGRCDGYELCQWGPAHRPLIERADAPVSVTFGVSNSARDT